MGNLVSYLLAAHLGGRQRSSPVEAPAGKRRAYTVQVWLTTGQQKELARRAKDEMRAVGNYATTVVLQGLARA